MQSITIDRRYRGPGVANGGYVCGLVASAMGGSGEVTLRAPPPLSQPLKVVRRADGSVELRNAQALLATGRLARSDIAEIPAAGFQVYTGMPHAAAKALPLLERALALEPDYAGAHGLLACCHEVLFTRAGLKHENRTAAIYHAHAALTHGRDDATALAMGAFVIAMVEHDRVTALDAFEQALAVSPSYPLTLFLGGLALAYGCEAERAIDWAERALRLSHTCSRQQMALCLRSSMACQGCPLLRVDLPSQMTQQTTAPAQIGSRISWSAFPCAIFARSAGDTGSASRNARARALDANG